MARRRGLDPRWLIAGATLVVVVAAVAVFSLFSGGVIGGGSGTGVVGEVTEATLGGPAASGLLPVGTAAPNLQWTLGGQNGSLAAERGHPVVLAFVATWCPHCQAEVAVLNGIHARYAERGVKVLGVTANSIGMDRRSRASLGDTELFVKQHNANYPHLYDAALVGAQRYGVRSFPSLYIIDGAGTIRFSQSGEVPEADLARAVDAALAPAG